MSPRSPLPDGESSIGQESPGHRGIDDDPAAPEDDLNPELPGPGPPRRFLVSWRVEFGGPFHRALASSRDRDATVNEPVSEHPMFPWFFLWAPRYHFPWSGAVKEDISPDTNWFFGSIQPGAGDGQIEQAIFQEASYGKQIGILTDVVLSLVDEMNITSDEGKKAVEQLKIVNHHVKEIKARYETDRADTAIRILEKLQESDPEEFERIVTRFRGRSNRLPT
jgi:hypothetical protein